MNVFKDGRPGQRSELVFKRKLTREGKLGLEAENIIFVLVCL